MFSYARKHGLVPQASVEHAVISEPDRSPYACSDGAKELVRTGIIAELVRSLAKFLRLKGEKPEAITEKVGGLIEAARKASDLTTYTAKYLLQMDWYAVHEYEYIPTSTNVIYDAYYRILDEAKCNKSFSMTCMEEARKKLTPNELAVLEGYDKAWRAFSEARELRDQVFGKAARKAVHDVLVQYSNVVTSIDAEFYETLASLAGIDTVSEIDDTNSDCVAEDAEA